MNQNARDYPISVLGKCKTCEKYSVCQIRLLLTEIYDGFKENSKHWTAPVTDCSDYKMSLLCGRKQNHE
jgi:hypothetical protein